MAQTLTCCEEPPCSQVRRGKRASYQAQQASTIVVNRNREWKKKVRQRGQCLRSVCGSRVRLTQVGDPPLGETAWRDAAENYKYKPAASMVSNLQPSWSRFHSSKCHLSNVLAYYDLSFMCSCRGIPCSLTAGPLVHNWLGSCSISASRPSLMLLSPALPSSRCPYIILPRSLPFLPTSIYFFFGRLFAPFFLPSFPACLCAFFLHVYLHSL